MNEDILIITPFAFMDSQQWGFSWFPKVNSAWNLRQDFCLRRAWQASWAQGETVAFLPRVPCPPSPALPDITEPSGMSTSFPLEIFLCRPSRFSYGSRYLKIVGNFKNSKVETGTGNPLHTSCETFPEIQLFCQDHHVQNPGKPGLIPSAQ